jgi:hypothetical protein
LTDNLANIIFIPVGSKLGDFNCWRTIRAKRFEVQYDARSEKKEEEWFNV